ncbi:MULTISPECIES: thiolase family protein [Comamonas]|uniref:Acetyl-CoA acetyltransferase n=2 Tax=Comamonas TaxID=283 RepID=A0A0E3BDR9_9BURK|nr:MULTISPECIES: thiolase family protein [Comamonas]AIJ48530.1 acetyl-CoA acetyltransferase [Comamonas testosteroni TK102]KGG91631.1 acetyl-CoA acetyltransferase [Comamonas thiooxydans]KGH12890.1 acetyl-CoA acetyltransferase [Comamonas thiooxydans]KGH23991.1 acetyl-CoA acetyltransferase [Comamonas thiooxydans]KGH25619.1 acetyl-CoA acetyltransferase [Comamonas thiooxydans]
MSRPDVVIVGAVRTPVGKFKGSLASVRADHLGAIVLDELITRSGLEPELVDDVIFGCVTQVGEQSANIARTALLGAGWPCTIPGLTIDRKCGSGEEAVHVAVGLIAFGSAEVVVAGGAENMSRVPMGSNRSIHGEAFGWMVAERYEMTSQGEAAERLCDQWELSRDDLDAFAAESHRRACAAASAGHFEREIVPVPVMQVREKSVEGEAHLFCVDETIRPGTAVEKLATLKTSFRTDGRLTAGNSSQISDGAAGLLLMSSAKARSLGLKPRARILAMTTVGSDPTLMLTGPIAATRKVLAQAGLTLDDIDLFEINEAFASVPLVWMKELGVSSERLNVNGGAIALGHPLGASGARIMTTMLHELERRGGRYALQAICCAGGMGTATLIERL